MALVGSKKYIDAVLTTPPGNGYWRAVEPWGLEMGQNGRVDGGTISNEVVGTGTTELLNEKREGLDARLPCLPVNIGGLPTWVYCLERIEGAAAAVIR